MSSQVFYRKWRPQTLSEVVGQEPTTRTLINALHRGRISHAYLFCGPRGTGKTSTARILAKAVNCLTSAGKDGSMELWTTPSDAIKINPHWETIYDRDPYPGI